MRIFMSYSTQDHASADALRRAVLARRPGLDVYFAPRRNEIGAYWIARMAEELRAADAVLLLLGRRVGPWQELEYYEALRRNRQGGRPVIAPVLLEDVAPGLPFLDHFHHLSAEPGRVEELIDLVLATFDGGRSGDAPAPWRALNPYRGLLAMETQDAAFFFGREGLTAAILERIVEHPDRIPILIGNSGVGKSSVAMAGVLAALRSQGWPGDPGRGWPEPLVRSRAWPIVRLTPGAMPVKTLAQAFVSLWLERPAEIEEESLRWQRLLRTESSLSALIDASLRQLAVRMDAEPPDRIVLYADQGEELYSRAEPGEAARFSQLLAEAVAEPTLLALMSLRSDYYGRLQGDAPLFRVASRVDVTPLDRAGLEQVIRLPAERLGVRFEHAGVIEHIAATAAREPGALPMLSDLLADAWRAMAEAPEADGVLRLPPGLVDISRPLAEKAERFVAAHAARTEVLRRLFTLKLALVPKEGAIMRRRARRDECTGEEWALIEAMAHRDWRLVTTGDEAGEPTAEVAHEALLRHWPRATRWLDESREFLIWRSQFELEHRAWVQAGADARERAWLTGLRLDIASRWGRERAEDLGEGERRFIDESRRAAADADARAQAAARRIARQRRWIQRVVSAALVLVALGALAALHQRGKAREAEQAAVAARDRAIRGEELARRQTDLAVARRLAMAAERVLDEGVGEATVAGLLAAESLRRSPTIEGQRILRRVLSLTPARAEEIATPWPHSRVDVSQDGRVTVFWRTRADGFRTGPAHGLAALVDTRSGQVTSEHAHHGRVWPVFSRDGRWMAIAGYGRRLQLFYAGDGRRRLDVHQDDMVDAVFGPESRTIYVVRTDGAIEVRRGPGWEVARRLGYPAGGDRVRRVSAEISPDGERLLVLAGASGSWLVPTRGGTPVALDADAVPPSGETVEQEHLPLVLSLAERRPGARRWERGLAPAGAGRTLKGVARGLFSPTGEHLVTVGWNGEVRIRDARGGTTGRGFQHAGPVTALAVSPDGRLIASATRPGEVWLSALETGATIHVLSHQKHVNALAFSPDGRLLATASDDATAAVWAVATGEKVRELSHEDEVWSVAFGDGERTLLTGGRDGALRVFDLATGAEVRRLALGGGVATIAPRPGAAAVAVGVRLTGNDQAWTDVSIATTGEGPARFEHNGEFSRLVVSADGRRLATATVGTGELKLWDAADGALLATRDAGASSIAFSPDGARLLARSGGAGVLLLDAADGRHIASLGEPGGVRAVRLLRDGRTMVSVGADRSFRGWDAVSGAALWSFPGDRRDVSGVELSADGKRFADRSSDRRAIEVGQTADGRVVATVPAGSFAQYRLSADGQRLLVVERAGMADRPHSELAVWDVTTGASIVRRRLEHSVVHGEFLGGSRIAVWAAPTRPGEPEAFVEVLDAASGERLWSDSFPGDRPSVHGAGRDAAVVVVDTGRGCQIRDAATGALRSPGEGRCPRGAVAFPGGERIALGRAATDGGDGDVIEIREVRSSTLHAGIRAGGAIRDIAVSGDGRLLMAAVGSDAGHRVRVWRTDDGSEVRSIDTGGSPWAVLPLADPDLVGIRDLGGTMGTWRISTGERVHVFAHAVGAAGLALATQADRAVTWLGGSLRLWNARSGAELAHAQSTSGVSEAAISPDGRTVAYLTEQTTGDARDEGLRALVLWEPGSKAPSRVLPLERPGGLQFDATGRRLAVRVGGDTVRVLEAPTLRALGSLRSGPGASIRDTAFGPDGALLFIREAKDRRVGLRVFALDRLREVSRIDTAHWQRTAGAWAVMTRGDDGRWWRHDLASVGADARLLEVDAQAFRHEPRSARFIARIEPSMLDGVPEFLRERVTIVPRVAGEFLNAWASDSEGRRLAVVSDAGISIHAADDGRELAVWPGVALAGAGLAVGFQQRPIRGLAFVGPGDALVAHDTSDYDLPGMRSRLWLWRWPGAEPALLSGEDPVNMVAASADGTLLASAEGFERHDRATGRSERIGQARVRVWDAATGAMVRAIPLSQVVDAVAFSADGTRLAARTAREVVVLGTRDGTEHTRFAFEGGELTAAGSVAFALGDRRVVAEAVDGIQSWALDGGEHRLLRHESKWPRSSLSPDGGLLLTTTREWLRIWDLESGAKRFELALEGRGLQSVALVGSGSELVATSERGVEGLRWKSEDLIAEACRRLGRDFSPEEWRRFFDDEGQHVTCAPS